MPATLAPPKIQPLEPAPPAPTTRSAAPADFAVSSPHNEPPAALAAAIAKELGGEPTWGVVRLFPCQGRWTESAYFQLPDRPGLELSEGRLEVLPVPSEAHQFISHWLQVELGLFVRTHNLGWVASSGLRVFAWQDEIREPDLVFLKEENRRHRTRRGWTGADLAVEIVSEGGEERDHTTKRQVYAKAGIPEYWIIDPKLERVWILTLAGDEYRDHAELGRGQVAASLVLPGFSVSVDDLFDAADDDYEDGS